MAYSAPSYPTIRDAILREIVSQLPDADVTSDSDNFVRSAAVAAVVEGIYQKLAWLYRQIFPDLADEEELLHHAAIRGLVQKAAVAATGKATVTGTAGTVLLTGSTIKHTVSGELLTTTQAAIIEAGGSTVVPIIASTFGAALNGLAGNLLLTSPPLGIDSTATLSEALTGGTDAESMASLLSRLLEVIRNPPAGGTKADYRRWALEVDGVATATVLPKRRGANTVDVVITASDGIPSDAVIEACAAHIDESRPVTAEVFVYAPLVTVVNVAASIELEDGYLLTDVQVAAQAAFEQEIGALLPGEGLKRSRVETILGNLAGVVDRLVQVPAGNMAASTDPTAVGWLRPGTVTLGVMA